MSQEPAICELCTVISTLEAILLKERLREHNIEVTIVEMDLQSSFGELPIAEPFVRPRLLVRVNELDRARKALKTIMNEVRKTGTDL